MHRRVWELGLTDQTDHTGHTDQTGHTEQPDQPGQTGQTDQTDQTDQKDQTDQTYNAMLLAHVPRENKNAFNFATTPKKHTKTQQCA